MEHLIATFGYPLVVLGSLIQGETVLVLAGLMAHRGYFELPWVVVAAVSGTVALDYAGFSLGRKHGQRILTRYPRWERRMNRIKPVINRNEALMIVVVRFIYGIRTAAPAVLGASGCPLGKFVVLDVLGATVFATVYVSLGYLLGRAVAQVVEQVAMYESLVVGCVVLLGILIWLLRRRSSRKPVAGHRGVSSPAA